MARAFSHKARPSLSLSPVVLARAKARLVARPGAHASLSAMYDAAMVAYLEAAETREAKVDRAIGVALRGPQKSS